MAALLAGGVLFGLAALVVDLGLGRDQVQASQISSDASSLAAANALYPASGACSPSGTPPCLDNAVARAKALALANYGVRPGTWNTCVDVDALATRPDVGNTCISFDLASTPQRVRVRMPTDSIATSFTGGNVSSVRSISISTYAEAVVQTGGQAACGLCVIGSGVHDLQNGDALVTNTSVYFNGSLSLNPQGSVTSQGGTVTIQGAGPSKGTVDPTPTTNTNVAIPDPMGALVLPPDMGGLTYKGSNMCSGGPGLYLNPTASGCTLTPGLYVVMGGTLGGNNGITATGVTMYFTCKSASANLPQECATNTPGGTIDLSGNGDFGITAPTTSSNKSIPGVALLFDRNNTQTLRLVGNGNLRISGALYMKSGTLDMRGNGCTTMTGLNSLIVVKDLAFSGANACLTNNFTADANYKSPAGVISLDR